MSPATTEAMRSDSLTRSSPMPSNLRVALGEGGGDRKDRVFVDHRRRARRRHRDALEPARPDPDVADLLAADAAAVLDGDVGAHLDQRLDQADARRVQEHVLDRDVGAFDDQRRDDREGGRARIARHDDLLRLEVGAAFEPDDPRPVLAGLGLDRGAERREHPLGMVAGRHRLDDGGGAGRR